MKFKDVKIGQLFFDDSTGEYYQKFDDEMSVVWDFEKNERFSDGSSTLESFFPDDHEVEGLE